MSALIRLIRVVAVSVVAAALPALAATSAYAADGDIEVRLSGLSSSLNAGGRSDSFSVRLLNQTDHKLLAFRVITVRLNGLTAEQVRLTRGFDLPKQAQEQGVVRFADPLAVGLGAEDERGDEASTNYQIRFLDGAPSGRATITAEAYVDQARSGADSDTVTVRGGVEGAPTSTPTLQPSNVPTITPGPQVSLSPLGALPGSSDGDGSGGVPVVLYLMGAVLVAIGGAILWLLLRQRPVTSPETAGYGPVPPYLPAHSPSGGGPGQNYPTRPVHRLNPTAIMPVIRDPQGPPPARPEASPPLGPPTGPPGVDPWAPRS